jgi:hypothetical protein
MPFDRRELRESGRAHALPHVIRQPGGRGAATLTVAHETLSFAIRSCDAPGVGGTWAVAVSPRSRKYERDSSETYVATHYTSASAPVTRGASRGFSPRPPRAPEWRPRHVCRLRIASVSHVASSDQEATGVSGRTTNFERPAST